MSSLDRSSAAAGKKKAQRLGNGWYAAYSEKHGRLYYFNTATNQRQWSEPEELKVHLAKGKRPDVGALGATAGTISSPMPAFSADAMSASTSTAAAAQDWTQHWDDKHKRTYYYNARTGQSAWENPDITKSRNDAVRSKVFDDDLHRHRAIATRSRPNSISTSREEAHSPRAEDLKSPLTSPSSEQAKPVRLEVTVDNIADASSSLGDPKHNERSFTAVTRDRETSESPKSAEVSTAKRLQQEEEQEQNLEQETDEARPDDSELRNAVARALRSQDDSRPFRAKSDDSGYDGIDSEVEDSQNTTRDSQKSLGEHEFAASGDESADDRMSNHSSSSEQPKRRKATQALHQNENSVDDASDGERDTSDSEEQSSSEDVRDNDQVHTNDQRMGGEIKARAPNNSHKTVSNRESSAYASESSEDSLSQGSSDDQSEISHLQDEEDAFDLNIDHVDEELHSTHDNNIDASDFRKTSHDGSFDSSDNHVDTQLRHSLNDHEKDGVSSMDTNKGAPDNRRPHSSSLGGHDESDLGSDDEQSEVSQLEQGNDDLDHLDETRAKHYETDRNTSQSEDDIPMTTKENSGNASLSGSDRSDDGQSELSNLQEEHHSDIEEEENNETDKSDLKFAKYQGHRASSVSEDDEDTYDSEEEHEDDSEEENSQAKREDLQIQSDKEHRDDHQVEATSHQEISYTSDLDSETSHDSHGEDTNHSDENNEGGENIYSNEGARTSSNVMAENSSLGNDSEISGDSIAGADLQDELASDDGASNNEEASIHNNDDVNQAEEFDLTIQKEVDAEEDELSVEVDGSSVSDHHSQYSRDNIVKQSAEEDLEVNVSSLPDDLSQELDSSLDHLDDDNNTAGYVAEIKGGVARARSSSNQSHKSDASSLGREVDEHARHSHRESIDVDEESASNDSIAEEPFNHSVHDGIDPNSEVEVHDTEACEVHSRSSIDEVVTDYSKKSASMSQRLSVDEVHENEDHASEDSDFGAGEDGSESHRSSQSKDFDKSEDSFLDDEITYQLSENSNHHPTEVDDTDKLSHHSDHQSRKSSISQKSERSSPGSTLHPGLDEKLRSTRSDDDDDDDNDDDGGDDDDGDKGSQNPDETGSQVDAIGDEKSEHSELVSDEDALDRKQGNNSLSESENDARSTSTSTNASQRSSRLEKSSHRRNEKGTTSLDERERDGNGFSEDDNISERSGHSNMVSIDSGGRDEVIDALPRHSVSSHEDVSHHGDVDVSSQEDVSHQSDVDDEHSLHSRETSDSEADTHNAKEEEDSLQNSAADSRHHSVDSSCHSYSSNVSGAQTKTFRAQNTEASVHLNREHSVSELSGHADDLDQHLNTSVAHDEDVASHCSNDDVHSKAETASHSSDLIEKDRGIISLSGSLDDAHARLIGNLDADLENMESRSQFSDQSRAEFSHHSDGVHSVSEHSKGSEENELAKSKQDERDSQHSEKRHPDELSNASDEDNTQTKTRNLPGQSKYNNVQSAQRKASMDHSTSAGDSSDEHDESDDEASQLVCESESSSSSQVNLSTLSSKPVETAGKESAHAHMSSKVSSRSATSLTLAEGVVIEDEKASKHIRSPTGVPSASNTSSERPSPIDTASKPKVAPPLPPRSVRSTESSPHSTGGSSSPKDQGSMFTAVPPGRPERPPYNRASSEPLPSAHAASTEASDLGKSNPFVTSQRKMGSSILSRINRLQEQHNNSHSSRRERRKSLIMLEGAELPSEEPDVAAAKTNQRTTTITSTTKVMKEPADSGSEPLSGASQEEEDVLVVKTEASIHEDDLLEGAEGARLRSSSLSFRQTLNKFQNGFTGKKTTDDDADSQSSGGWSAAEEDTAKSQPLPNKGPSVSAQSVMSKPSWQDRPNSPAQTISTSSKESITTAPVPTPVAPSSTPALAVSKQVKSSAPAKIAIPPPKPRNEESRIKSAKLKRPSWQPSFRMDAKGNLSVSLSGNKDSWVDLEGEECKALADEQDAEFEEELVKKSTVEYTEPERAWIHNLEDQEDYLDLVEDLVSEIVNGAVTPKAA